MFFFRSCSASVVCLVSTFLLVYISHCDSVPVTADSYLSTGLFPTIKNIFNTPLSQIVRLESLFKSNCSQNEVDPEKDLQSCVLDYTATVGRLSKSPVVNVTSELNSVFKEFCMNRTALQECFQRSYQESSHCWMDGIRKNWPLITDLMNSVSSFACSDDGNLVAQFLDDGGSQCLLDKEEDIKVCISETISSHTPTRLQATPERQLDKEDCNDIKTMQKCALKHLEMCKTKSTAEIINATVNRIWNLNCSNLPTPVLDRPEIQGDLDDNERGIFNIAVSFISIAYVAGETIAKSAVSTLTSIITTAKEASPELDTNDGLGSSDSIAPLESTPPINKVDDKDDLSMSRKVEENSTHGDNFFAREDVGEPTEDYSDDVQMPVHAYRNDEIEELPSDDLGTTATYHYPTDASKTDIIPIRTISAIGPSTTSMHVDFTTTGPPVDHASILSHTTLLVVSSYVVLSLVIIVLIVTLYCESLLPQAD